MAKLTPNSGPRCAVPPCAGPPRANRSALTLVELLVVVVLVTTLVTTAIPVLAPGGDSRRLREASRAVNSFLAGAQARAVETGRPYGVALKRLSAVTGDPRDNGMVVELAYVEVPPVYAGLDSGAMVRVGQKVDLVRSTVMRPLLPNHVQGFVPQLRMQFVRRGQSAGNDGLPPGWDYDLVPGSFLRPGDVVETGGKKYRLIIDDDPDTRDFNRGGGPGRIGFWDGILPGDSSKKSLALVPLVQEAATDLELRYAPGGMEMPGPEATPGAIQAAGVTNPEIASYWATPTPYKIHRQPVPAAGQPLQLPAGIAIDLAASGFPGIELYRPSDTYDGKKTPTPSDEPSVFSDEVLVLFSPDGGIERARLRHPDTRAEEETAVTSSLSLCIARRELIPAPQATGQTDIDWPINPLVPAIANAFDTPATRETLAKYNWLNPDTRWVVVGAATGTVTTVENAVVYPGQADLNGDGALSMAEQLAAARANAPRRAATGGR